MKKLNRRQFLRLSGAAAAAGLLAGCGPTAQEPAVKPTDTLAATHTPAPGSAGAPTLAPTVAPTNAPTPAQVVASRRPEIIKFYPDVASKVVQVHHAGVWTGAPKGDKGDNSLLNSDALSQMLDASIIALTGLDGPTAAWQALFAPNERIAIKVNVFRNSVIWTHLPLVQAVTDSLQKAGIPAEQITIFDYYTSELEEAGYPINRDGSGVRCYGTDEEYTAGFSSLGRNIKLSNILLNCDALINMPILKSHMISGITFALKNHYGSLSQPSTLHSSIGPAMAELNALPPIKDRTRLIIGDMLQACVHHGSSWPYWKADTAGDSILMSFDPVAHDTIGLQRLTKMLSDDGGSTTSMMSMATPCLESGAKLNLGANNPDNIDLVEQNLG